MNENLAALNEEVIAQHSVAFSDMPGTWSVKPAAFGPQYMELPKAMADEVARIACEMLQPNDEYRPNGPVLFFYENGLNMMLNITYNFCENNPQMRIPYEWLADAFVEGLVMKEQLEDEFNIGDEMNERNLKAVETVAARFMHEATRIKKIAETVRAQYEEGRGDHRD